MNILIKSMDISNFKGILSLHLDFHDGVNSLYGENASGKTSVYDALTWLLFDKDSHGNSRFSVKPTGATGGVMPEVTAILSVNGEEIKLRKLMLHRVGSEVRVLTDINTFVSVTDEKKADFSSNQVIRVLDQIANDIATLFNTKYLGKVQNDAAGRVSLWSDIVQHHNQLQTIRAIENFDSEQVMVQAGDLRKAVAVADYVQPVSAMEQLYMVVTVQ